MSALVPLEDCYMPEPNSGCWLWLLSTNEKGYGRRWDGTRERKAHTVVYELHVGPVPEGKELDHICRVRCCVNPAHLMPVTHQENVQRGGLLRRGTHCKRGHPLVDGNLYIVKGRYRRCRQCVIDRMRAR